VGVRDALFSRLNPQGDVKGDPLPLLEAAPQARQLPRLEERLVPLRRAARGRFPQALEGRVGLRQAPPGELQAADQPPAVLPVGAGDVGEEGLLVQHLLVGAAGHGDRQAAGENGEEILVDDGPDDRLDLDLLVGIGDDDGEPRLVDAPDGEVPAEPVNVPGVLHGQGEIVLEAAVVAVGRVPPAVGTVDLQDGLAHQEAPGVVVPDGEAEEGIDARCGLKDGLPQPPAAPRGGPFDGPADVAPEVVEVVLLRPVVPAAVVADIARQPAGAEVLDDEEVHGPPVVDPVGKADVLRLEVLAQPLQVARRVLCAETLPRGREGDDDSHRLAGQARIERVLDGLPDHRVGQAAQDLGGEELALDGVHVDLAPRHGAEFPERLIHDRKAVSKAYYVKSSVTSIRCRFFPSRGINPFA